MAEAVIAGEATDEGAVVGIDVGYSPTQRSSAICRLVWSRAHVTWTMERFRALEPERTHTIERVTGGIPLQAAALDGPLRRGFDVIGKYRTAERMLTRRLQPVIGKPGQSSAPVGRQLNHHANECARILLDLKLIGPASHPHAIDDAGILEAFPTSFLGVMLPNPIEIEADRGNRSDAYFAMLSAAGVLDDLVDHLLPGRSFSRSPSDITNHDDRAALVCALTALCVARGDYTAVGDDDGWIILPPPAFVQPWARSLLETNAAGEAPSALFLPPASGRYAPASDNGAPAEATVLTRAQSAEGTLEAVGTVSMQQLMACVGYVLLHWSFVEKELNDAVAELRRADARSPKPLSFPTNHLFGIRLQHWRELCQKVGISHPVVVERVRNLSGQLGRIAAVRNALCHQIISASVGGGRAHITCRSDPGAVADDSQRMSTVTFHHADLERIIVELERGRQEVSEVTRLALEAGMFGRDISNPELVT